MTEPIKLRSDTLTVQLLRDGVNKHRAREIEHWVNVQMNVAIEQATAEMRAENERLREAAKQALDTLESLQGGCTDAHDGTVEAITVWCPEIIEALHNALKETK
jgi:hypothetical protein